MSDNVHDNDAVTVAEFYRVFKAGVETLNLSGADIAKTFSADLGTQKRWLVGRSAPTPGARKMLVREMNKLTDRHAAVLRSKIRKALGNKPLGEAGTDVGRIGFAGPGAVRRRAVLKETLDALGDVDGAYYGWQAAKNLEQW